MPDVSGSGINPNISLGGSPPGGAATVNPLGMAATLADVQNKLNQNKLFQQQFQANQGMGQIFATESDPETAIAKILQSPYAPFAMPAIGGYRQAMQTAREIAGKRSEQNLSALQAFGKNSAAAANDVSLLPGIVNRTLAGLDPLIRKDAEPIIRSAAAALMAGVDPKSPGALDKFRANHIGLLTASGMTGEAQAGVYGTATTRETGGEIQSGVQRPPGMGGGFVPANAVEKTLPPTLTTVKPAALGGADQPGVVTGGSTFTPLTQAGGTPSGTTDANALGVPKAPAPLTGLTPEATELQKKSAEIVGGIREKMSDQASQFPGQMHSLDVLRDMLTQAQAGGGANIRAQAASLVQMAKNMGISIDKETVDKIGNQSLPASQTFSAIVNQVATRMLSADVHGQGKSMLPEVKAYLEQMSLATSPEAILNILNNMKFSMTTGFEQSKAYGEFRKKKEAGDPEVKDVPEDQFYSWYAQQQEKAGKLSTAPLSPVGVKGIEPKARRPLTDFFK